MQDYSTSKNFIGNKDAKNNLYSAYKNNKYCGSWLISGPKGIGKVTLVYDFLINLYKDITNAPKRILNGTFPDFLYIKSELGKEITINQIRAINKFLSQTSAEAKERVVLINAAEDMNKNAINALLKTLEEPPNNSIIFLVSHNYAKLLPTVRSRCKHIKMYPLDYDDFCKVLNVTDNQELYEIANGCPGIGQKIIEYDGFNLYKEIINNANNKDLLKFHALAEKVASNNDIKLWFVVEIILNYLIANIIKLQDNLLIRNCNKDQLLQLAKLNNKHAWHENLQYINKFLYEANHLSLDKKIILINIFNLLTSKKK